MLFELRNDTRVLKTLFKGWNCECNEKATSRLQPAVVPVNSYGTLLSSPHLCITGWSAD